MTAIRTRYLWKRCSHCGETTVCREVSQHYLLTHGACATRVFNGPPVIGEHGYFCADCDPEANPPEAEPFIGKSPLPGEDTFALDSPVVARLGDQVFHLEKGDGVTFDVPTRGRWVGVEHRVTFPWEPYLDGGIDFRAYDVMDAAIEENALRALGALEDRRRVQVSHPNLAGALSEKRIEQALGAFNFRDFDAIDEILRDPNEGADLSGGRGVDFPPAEPDATGTP